MSQVAKTLRIMGVLNVTPDSFFDGGCWQGIDRSVERVAAMIAEGADIIDIGGESSRPGSDPVSIEEELERVLPIVEAVHARFPDVTISIDTYKPVVAQRAVDLGATIINDITGFSNHSMAELMLNRPELNGVIMHMQGEPKSMQEQPHYDDVVAEVSEFFESRLSSLATIGIARERLIVDPGIGFGKTLQHNLSLIKNLRQFERHGCEILVGASRKSFIGKILDVLPDERLEGSIAAALIAVQNGASIVRVHDIASTIRCLQVGQAIAMAK